MYIALFFLEREMKKKTKICLIFLQVIALFFLCVCTRPLPRKNPPYPILNCSS